MGLFSSKKARETWALVTFEQYADEFYEFATRLRFGDYESQLDEITSGSPVEDPSIRYLHEHYPYFHEQIVTGYDARLMNCEVVARSMHRPVVRRWLKDCKGAIVLIDALTPPRHYAFEHIHYKLDSTFNEFLDEEWNRRTPKLFDDPNVPVLILCFNTDKPGGITPSEMMLHLKLNEFRKPWHFEEVNSKTGLNIKKGLDWLKQTVDNRKLKKEEKKSLSKNQKDILPPYPSSQ